MIIVSIIICAFLFGSCSTDTSDLGTSTLEYESYGDGTCEVTGVSDYSEINIVIPSTHDDETVIEIGDYAFENYTNLESITFSDSINEIGEYAFSGCTSLTSVALPESLTGIGVYCFDGCTSLESISFEDTDMPYWYAFSSNIPFFGGYTDVTDVSANAEYLTATYVSCIWWGVDSEDYYF